LITTGFNGPWVVGVSGGLAGIVASQVWQRLCRRPIQLALRRQLNESNRPVCMECGFDLRDNTSRRCPECGTAFKANEISH
jgi:uncharacterized paraquat-inducible protein A